LSGVLVWISNLEMLSELTFEKLGIQLPTRRPVWRQTTMSAHFRTLAVFDFELRIAE
jgi:hypothetical protein